MFKDLGAITLQNSMEVITVISLLVCPTISGRYNGYHYQSRSQPHVQIHQNKAGKESGTWVQPLQKHLLYLSVSIVRFKYSQLTEILITNQKTQSKTER